MFSLCSNPFSIFFFFFYGTRLCPKGCRASLVLLKWGESFFPLSLPIQAHLELSWVTWDFSCFFVLLLFFKFGSQEPLVNEPLGLWVWWPEPGKRPAGVKEERSGSRNPELWYRHRWPELNTHLGRVLSQCFLMAVQLLGNVHVYRLVITTMTGKGFISFVQKWRPGAWWVLGGDGLEGSREACLLDGSPAVGCSPSVLASVTRVEGHCQIPPEP